MQTLEKTLNPEPKPLAPNPSTLNPSRILITGTLIKLKIYVSPRTLRPKNPVDPKP